MTLVVLKRYPKITAWSAFAALLLYALWPLTYSAESITARLVDADTNEPIAGAIIVAHWELVGGLEGGSVQGQMMVMEAESDADGYFHFPAWGPRLIPPRFPPARLGFRDPALLIFKPGYQMGEAANEKTGKQLARKGPERRSSQWNGKAITLRKADASSARYREHLSVLNSNLRLIAVKGGNPCGWTRIPKMVLAVRNEGRRFERDFRYSDFYDNLLQNESHMQEYGCGSPREFFAGYER